MTIERFVYKKIHRSQIHFADYNPRKINPKNKARLKAQIKKHGLVQPIVWNERTGNDVGGNQRLAILDELHKSQDYHLTVAAIDINERDEVALNVALNNPSSQGEWDFEILTELGSMFEEGFDLEKDFGFSSEEVSLIWGDFDKAFEPADTGTDTGTDTDPASSSVSEEDKQKFRDAKKQGRENAKINNADGNGYAPSRMDFFLTIVFETADEKRDFLDKIGQPAHIQRILAKDL